MKLKEDCEYPECKKKAEVFNADGKYLCMEHYILDRFIDEKIDKIVDVLGLVKHS